MFTSGTIVKHVGARFISVKFINDEACDHTYYKPDDIGLLIYLCEERVYYCRYALVLSMKDCKLHHVFLDRPIQAFLTQ